MKTAATKPTAKTPRDHARDLRSEAERLEDVARQFRAAARVLDPRGRPPVNGRS